MARSPRLARVRRLAAGSFALAVRRGRLPRRSPRTTRPSATPSTAPAERYVSRKRLQQMIDYEYDLLLSRLDSVRGDKRVSLCSPIRSRPAATRTRRFQRLARVKFQPQPRAEASQVMIHVRLLDEENLHEQEALGIIGVNLIFGALFQA